MKKLLYILAAAFVSLLTISCEKEETGLNINGEWHTAMTVTVGNEQTVVADVYVSFTDGSFVLYQKTGEQMRHYIYTGTYTSLNGVLKGTYSDGSRFGCDYELALEGETLTMTAMNELGDVIIYTKTEIPADVKANAVPYLKSEELPRPVL